MINYQENNKVDVIGYVDSEIVSSHRVHGEEFLTFTLRVPRLSETYDFINTTISKRLMVPEISEGAKVWIRGQYRSYNNYDDKGNKLILTLFVQEIDPVPDAEKPHSEIILDGFICKEPVYRKTPFGREIADMIYERHQLLSAWLVKLGVDEKTASEDACKIEHVISKESFEAIKKHVNKK